MGTQTLFWPTSNNLRALKEDPKKSLAMSELEKKTSAENSGAKSREETSVLSTEAWCRREEEREEPTKFMLMEEVKR